jgi:type IV secretory pathway VirB10-like protein
MAQNVNRAGSVPASPSVATSIGSTGLRGKITGVTRFGSRAGLIVVGLLGAIGLAIVYGISTSGSHPSTATAVAPAPQILATAGPFLAGIPGADVTPPPVTVPTRPTPPPPSKPASQHPYVAAPAPAAPAAVPALPDAPPQSALVRTQEVPDVRALPQTAQTAMQAVSAVAPAIDAAKALKMQREQLALQAADAARHAAILVGATSGASASTDARQAPLTPAAVSAAAAAAPGAAAAGSAATGAQPNAAAATDPTTASQRAKAEFVSLQKSTTANDYLTTPRQASISPYEVQAGSIIPAILVTGINSDLPGQMIGQVSQNVYDSKTGTYLLIPAGAKLVGRYDSQVTNGQSRVLVAWQRIIFPDSSFIDIDGLAGADTAGYTGLTGKVDDHTGKLFRNAILTSLIGAGTALLQPRTALTAITPVGAVMAQPSVGATIAGQVGTQVAQVAQQVGNQGVQQQPTIEVRPGYLFNILVDRDLVLPGPFTK